MTPRLRALVASLLAAGGIVAGHALAYSATMPDEHARFELLEATGHAYWPGATVAGGALFLGALIVWVARGADPGRRTGWFGLAGLQTGGFVILELTERALSSGHVGDLPLILLGVGVAFQLLIAGGISLLLRVVRAIVHRTISRPQDRLHAGAWSVGLPAETRTRRRDPFVLLPVARGPPVTA